MTANRYDGTVNEVLKSARLERNLTCEEVALQNGICTTTYFTYEQYSKTPTLYIAYKLADFFDKSVEELFPPEIVKPDKRHERRGAKINISQTGQQIHKL